MGFLLHESIENGSLKFRKYLVEAAEKGIYPDEKMYAIDLDEVEKGNTEDARDFFERTELTNSQKELIREVLMRLSGIGSSNSAFLLDTVMGGGKTHTLSFLYYMLKFKSIASARQEIREILEELGLESIPQAEVILVNGLNLNPNLPLSKQSKLKYFFEGDATKENVTRIIENDGKPYAFIVDEFIEYLNKRAGVLAEHGERLDYYSDLSFFRTLVEGVINTSASVFIMTVPSDAPNRGLYEKIVSFFRMSARQAKILHPLDEKADLPRIIRRQLIENVKKEVPKQASRWVKDVLKKEGITVDEEQYETYYPFNPRLIDDIFVNAFAQFPNFQKTRKTLSMLSKVVTDIIRRAPSEEFSSPYINAGDVDLNSIKDDVTSENIFEMWNLQNTVNADILRPELKTLQRRLATTIYLYSLNKEEKKAGVDITTLFEANPDDKMGSKEYEEVVDEYYKKYTEYLHYIPENKRYRFTTQRNIWSLIRREAEKISDVSKLLKFWFSELDLGDEINVIYSQTPIVDLQHKKVNLVVAPYDVFSNKDAKEAVEEFIEKQRLFSGTVSYLNSIIVLYPPANEKMSFLVGAAKEALAVQELQKVRKSEKDTMKLLEQVSAEVNQRFTNSMIDCYEGFFYYGSRSQKVHSSITLTERKQEAYVKELRGSLSKNQKVYLKEGVEKDLDVQQFFAKLLGERIELGIKQAYGAVESNPNLPFLPYDAFKMAVEMGVQKGYIGLATGMTDMQELSGVKIIDNPSSISEEYFILSKERLEYIRNQLARQKTYEETSASTLHVDFVPRMQPTRVPPSTEAEVTILVNVSNEASIKESNKLIAFLRNVEQKWRLSDLSIKNFDVELILNASGNEITLKSDISKIGYLRQLVEYLCKAFEGKDYRVRVTARLDQKIAKELQKEGS